MLNLGRFEAVGTVPSKTWSILYLNIFDFSYVFMACPRACPRSLILSCQGCVAKLGKKKKTFELLILQNRSVYSKSIQFQGQVCWILELHSFFQVATCQILCDVHLHLPQIRPLCLPTPTFPPSYFIISFDVQTLMI